MRRYLCLMSLILTLTLTSCGGADSPTTTIDVTMTDFMFQPSQFIVPAGQEIAVSTRNNSVRGGS